MLGPIQTLSYQFDGGRIDNLNRTLKPESKSGPTALAKARLQASQMLQRVVRQLFAQARVPRAIGVRQTVLAGRGSSANGRKRTRVQRQSITDIVESQTVGQLGIKQADHMAPRTKRSALIFNPQLPRQTR